MMIHRYTTLPNTLSFINKLIKAMLLLLVLRPAISTAQDTAFTLDQVMAYPFPNELSAASDSDKIAWAVNASGRRNIFVAEGPGFQARQLTKYGKDEGQELSSVAVSADGQWIVYIRGGDFGSNWDDAEPVNPTGSPEPTKVQLWSVPFAGGEPVLLGEGISPAISPDSRQVAFVKDDQLWTVPIDGAEKARQRFSAKGKNDSPVWSPDGSKLAFRSDRGDHAFIGIYQNDTTAIMWIDPSFHHDSNPRWSPDGKNIAFIRQPVREGKPDAILAEIPRPWSVMRAEAKTGKAQALWQSPHTMPGSVPTTQGGFNLHWAAGHMVFLSYQDGWPHLYSIPEGGGKPLLLTKGNYMAEYISLSPDKKWLYFTANTGPDTLDIDRRHVVRVPVNKAATEVLTPGKGNEWTPILTGKNLAFISATAQRPPLPAVMDIDTRKISLIGEKLIPKDFPASKLIVPQQVVFKAPDGKRIHATLFKPKDGAARRSAVVYVHGGPPRQMLLGWHYSSYYANAYAMNQYLASQGFVVLAVNYRLGIGYGYEFHNPADGGSRGASEYQDIKAAGQWLAKQPYVEADQIGIYGGSYGGYLTAMALGRDSKLFAAGVDIHGVHNRVRGRYAMQQDAYEQAPDLQEAMDVAWQSSPVSSVDTWTSPVLIIHADDDRNVSFSQSTDLVSRLREKDVAMETMVIVDDTHHFMMHRNQRKVNQAIAAFLIKHLKL